MNLALQTHPQSVPQLTDSVSKIESCLVSLKAELTSLETRLNQTRGEYRRALRHLQEVKTQIAIQSAPASANHGAEDIDLEPDIDPDWEYLIKQIASL
jgi:chromosome segregation ATPase